MAEKNLQELYIELKVKSDDLDKRLNQLSAQGKKAANDIESGFSGGTKSLKTFALQAIAATGIITLLANAFKRSVEEISGQIDAENKLASALGYTSEKLKDRASELQKITKFGDDQILGANAIIAAFTKEEDQIIALTNAAMDLASAQGIDLNTAAEQVAKTFAGGRSVLKSYGIDIEGAAGSTERLTNLTTAISTLWGGRAEADAKTFSGRVEIIRNKINEVYEKIGTALLPTLESLATAFGNMVDKVDASQSTFEDISLIFKVTAAAATGFGASLVFVGKVLGTIGAGVATLIANLYKGPFAFREMQKAMKSGFDDAINSASTAYTFISDLFKEPIKPKVEFELIYPKGTPGYKEQNKGSILNGTEEPTAPPTNVAKDALKNYNDLKNQVAQYDKLLKNTNLSEQEKNILLKERIALLEKIKELEQPPTIETGTGRGIEPNLPASVNSGATGARRDLGFGVAGNVAGPSQEFGDKFTLAVDGANELNNALQAIGETFVGLNDAASMFGQAFDKKTAAYKAAAVIQATVATYLAASKALAEVPFPFNFAAAAAVTVAGIANVSKILKAHEGGIFENGKKIAKFASGGAFTVPAGYPNDSYLMAVESGERVSVTPTNAVGSQEKYLIKLISSVNALSRNLQSNNSQQNVAVLNVDGKDITKAVFMNMNEMQRAGIDLSFL